MMEDVIQFVMHASQSLSEVEKYYAVIEKEAATSGLAGSSESIECSGSEVELQTLEKEDPGSNPVLQC